MRITEPQEIYKVNKKIKIISIFNINTRSNFITKNHYSNFHDIKIKLF